MYNANILIKYPYILRKQPNLKYSQKKFYFPEKKSQKFWIFKKFKKNSATL